MQALVALALMKLYGDGVPEDAQGASDLLDRFSFHSHSLLSGRMQAIRVSSETRCACVGGRVSPDEPYLISRSAGCGLCACVHSAAAQGGAPLATAAARVCVWLQRTGWMRSGATVRRVSELVSATVRRVSELVSAVASGCGRLTSLGGESGSPMMAAVRVVYGRVLRLDAGRWAALLAVAVVVALWCFVTVVTARVLMGQQQRRAEEEEEEEEEEARVVPRRAAAQRTDRVRCTSAALEEGEPPQSAG
jgi:hypothetical protein